MREIIGSYRPSDQSEDIISFIDTLKYALILCKDIINISDNNECDDNVRKYVDGILIKQTIRDLIWLFDEAVANLNRVCDSKYKMLIKEYTDNSAKILENKDKLLNFFKAVSSLTGEYLYIYNSINYIISETMDERVHNKMKIIFSVCNLRVKELKNIIEILR